MKLFFVMFKGCIHWKTLSILGSGFLGAGRKRSRVMPFFQGTFSKMNMCFLDFSFKVLSFIFVILVRHHHLLRNLFESWNSFTKNRWYISLKCHLIEHHMLLNHTSEQNPSKNGGFDLESSPTRNFQGKTIPGKFSQSVATPRFVGSLEIPKSKRSNSKNITYNR